MALEKRPTISPYSSTQHSESDSSQRDFPTSFKSRATAFSPGRYKLQAFFTPPSSGLQMLHSKQCVPGNHKLPSSNQYQLLQQIYYPRHSKPKKVGTAHLDPCQERQVNKTRYYCHPTLMSPQEVDHCFQLQL